MAIELPMLGVAVAWLVMRRRVEHRTCALARRFAALAVAVLLGEQTMLRAYGYHFYCADWALFIADVPLTIVVFWATMIDAAYIGARRLCTDARLAIVLTGMIVAADAAMIQPLAVHAGILRYNAMGPLGVPPIAVIAWGVFGAAAARHLLANDDDRFAPMLADALSCIGSTHLAVVLTWHAGIWRLERPWPWIPLCVGAWVLALAVVAIAHRATGRTSARGAAAELDRSVRTLRIMLASLVVAIAVGSAAPPSHWIWAAAVMFAHLGVVAGAAGRRV